MEPEGQRISHMKLRSSNIKVALVACLLIGIIAQVTLYAISREERQNVWTTSLLFDGNIDLVYTWCNGSDPNYIAQRRLYVDETADSPQRYRYHDELRYSLRSVDVYALWIRNIYIVSDETPSWLNETNPRIKIVRLEEIFPPERDYLPNFNSQSIESVIHRIPGLSPKFLYMNDDFFFGQPTTPYHFVDKHLQHKIYLNGDRPINIGENPGNLHRVATAHSNDLLNRLFGPSKRYDHAHSPQLFDVGILRILELAFPKPFHETRSHRFRNKDDYQIQFLALQLMIEGGLAKPIYGEGSNACSYQTAETIGYCLLQDNLQHNKVMLEGLKRKPPLFFSINDSIKKVSEWPEEQTQLLQRFFEDMYPVPSQYELRE